MANMPKFPFDYKQGLYLKQ